MKKIAAHGASDAPRRTLRTGKNKACIQFAQGYGACVWGDIRTVEPHNSVERYASLGVAVSQG